MKSIFSITEEIVYFNPKLRLSWAERGTWPHSSHYGFHEAVVAAHFRILGYEALHDYNAMKKSAKRPVCNHYNKLFHEIIGEKISHFLRTELRQKLIKNHGQPDLFVFREDCPQDPKIRYSDSLLWFFVEVKGIGESIRDTQLEYWHAIAEREDLDLGPKRIRLFRALPEGTEYSTQTFDY